MTGRTSKAGMASSSSAADTSLAPQAGRTATPLDGTDRRLLAAIQDGLPLATRPYAEIGTAIGLVEDEVIARLARLRQSGIIRRFGVVVRPHEAG
mgnify:FL=1